MKNIIGILSVLMLVPLCLAISGLVEPTFLYQEIAGVPFAIVFVLIEMAILVGLCWLSMKVAAAENPETPLVGTPQPAEKALDN